MERDEKLEQLKRQQLKELVESASSPKMEDGKPTRVDSASFETIVLNSRTPVVVDFFADWCGPCHAVAPHVERLAARYGGRIRFAKLNVDENPELAERFEILSIPTLVFFRGGRVVDRLVGAVPYRTIEQRVEQLAAS